MIKYLFVLDKLSVTFFCYNNECRIRWRTVILLQRRVVFIALIANTKYLLHISYMLKEKKSHQNS